MAKFADLTNNEKINLIRGEFNSLVESILVNDEDLKKSLSNEDFEKLKAYVPEIKDKECGCGQCVEPAKYSVKIPPELMPVLAVARKRCEERNNY